MRYTMDWEPLDIEVRAWAAEGKSRNWIANELCKRGLGCTRNAVIGRLWRIGVRSPHTASERSTIGNQTKRDAKHSNLLVDGRTLDTSNDIRIRRRERREQILRWKDSIEVGAPIPLNIPADDLEQYHCRAVMPGTGDRCQPLYCGHPVGSRSFCDYHHALFYQRV